MNSHRIVFSLALAEIRQGWKHFSVFIICLALGVTILGAVGGIGSVISTSLEREAKSLLGGDIEARLRSVEASEEELSFLKSYGAVSYIATLRSMLYVREESILVEVKAIDEAYPLVGKLLLNETISRDAALANGGVIIDSILLSQLGLKIGDEISLGSKSYTIRATLNKEPDRAVQIFSFGPRVMMSHESLRQSGLISTFSLIEHRYRILAPNSVTRKDLFANQIKSELKTRFPSSSWRVDAGTEGNQTIERFTSQLLSFLTLSGFATFLIAGIGIGSSARSYLGKKLQTIAVFKSLGASRRTVLAVYLAVLGSLALIGSLLGIMIALTIVFAAIPLISPILPVVGPDAAPSALPFLLSLWYGILIVYLFSMPALLGALKTRPSLLFRSKTSALQVRGDQLVWWVTGTLALLLFTTLTLTATDKAFMLGAMGVMLIAFLLFGLCAAGVRKAARMSKVKQPWLRLALGNLHRRGSTSGTVIFAIGISLTVLIALTLTEANFQSRIQVLVKEKAPSLFMLDIQPHQQEGLKLLLSEYADTNRIMLYPMIRGRIVAINGKPIHEQDVDADVRWAVRGDRGISTATSIPENARVVEGQWWPEDYQGPPLLSVDKRFLKGMGLKVGSILTLSVLGEEITATVANARDIDYTTFQINFSMMLSPGVIDSFPSSYLATVHLSSPQNKEAELARRISREFPGVTIIRTAEVISVVREIVGHIATALRITVGISLLAGVLVLVSALGATLEQRLYDVAVLKVFGARRSDILKSCIVEWMLLALATSVIAAGLGTLASWLITQRFWAQDFSPMPEVILMTVGACVIVVWVTGYLGNRRLFNLSPSGLLRNE